MTEVLDPQPTEKVYEVGTGSGYQSAILSRLVKEVYSVEIQRPLSERAPPCTRSWATRTSTPGLATATRVGPRRHRSMRSSSPAPAAHPQALDRPAQGRGPDGHSAGKPVQPDGSSGHQERRQADGQGAQADPFRAHDRKGPQGEAEPARCRRGPQSDESRPRRKRSGDSAGSRSSGE